MTVAEAAVINELASRIQLTVSRILICLEIAGVDQLSCLCIIQISLAVIFAVDKASAVFNVARDSSVLLSDTVIYTVHKRTVVNDVAAVFVIQLACAVVHTALELTDILGLTAFIIQSSFTVIQIGFEPACILYSLIGEIKLSVTGEFAFFKIPYIYKFLFIIIKSAFSLNDTVIELSLKDQVFKFNGRIESDFPCISHSIFAVYPH